MADFAPRLMANILPNNATLYERALVAAGEPLLDIDVPLRRLWNPWTCPEPLLPYLAWTLSVDIWDATWPEPKRRSVIANALKHHRLKGTLGGIEAYLDLIGVEVVSAITPPAKVYSGPTLTRDEREAWLRRLPQVRVWREYERGVAGHRIFLGGPRHASFLEAGAPHPNTAMERLRRRARWIENGVESTARVESYESNFRVFHRGVRPHSAFCNRPLGRRFLVPSTAHQRIVTIEPVALSAWRSPIGPSLQPVTSEPELVAERGTEGRTVYSGRPLHGRFFVPSTAGYRLYERYAVNDGSQVKKRPSIQFMGQGRYGQPGHTAELKLKVRGKRPSWQAGEGIFVPRARFWLPHDPTPMDRTRQAINAARRLTDRILIDTTTKPGYIAGLPFWAGDEYRA